MNIRYRVELNEAERAQLMSMLSGGKHAVRKLKRAQILLAADAGVSDEAIVSSVSVGGSTVYRTKRRFVEGNLELALSEETRPGAPRKLSGKVGRDTDGAARDEPRPRGKGLIPRVVGRQIVHHDANQIGPWVMNIDELVHTLGEILRCALVGDLHLRHGRYASQSTLIVLERLPRASGRCHTWVWKADLQTVPYPLTASLEASRMAKSL